VRSDDCSALVGQVTVEQKVAGIKGPYVFEENYEDIPAKIPATISQKFLDFISQNVRVENGFFRFKSHIHCEPMTS
jgi:hypothetical protein